MAVTPKSIWEPRFWTKVNKTNTCWLWTDCVDQDGYGRFYINGRSARAHRVALELYLGRKLSVNKYALHARDCTNKRCVRREHLYEGTKRDNSWDYYGEP